MKKYIKQKVCIQGLGFVGAAMAIAVSNAVDDKKKYFFDVVGIDLKSSIGIKRIKDLNAGIFPYGNTDPKLDWTILRNSKLNICANSTFSYSAAILNYKNISSKLRCIVPQWISKDKSSKEIGWISLPGFFDL